MTDSIIFSSLHICENRRFQWISLPKNAWKRLDVFMSSGHSSSTREICGKFENARRLGERGDTRNVLLRVCQRRVQHLLALHQKPRPVDSTVALIRGDKSRPSKITGGCGVSPDTTKHSSAKRLYRGVASTTRLTNAGHVKMRLRHRWPRSERKNRESPG